VAHIDGVAKPYLVCGGFPAGNSWIFLGPRGKVEIQGANAALAALLPLFDGMHELAAIIGSVGERKDVLALIEMLIDHRIVVDANHLYRHFQAYARDPSLFSMGTSHEENVANYYDFSHVPQIHGATTALPVASTGLSRLLRSRTSCRRFSAASVDEADVFDLIWSMYGRQDEPGPPAEQLPYLTFTVPSGGGLYPLFVYLLLFRHSGKFEVGTYLWHKERSLLEMTSESNPLPAAARLVIGVAEAAIERAAGMICIVADLERSAKKYGNHAYNLALLEAGHLMQNAALFCTERRLGFVELYGFLAEDLARLLESEPPRKSPVVAALFGKADSSDP
jgi:SagB-type dehydrogenase family enzyme